MTDPDQSRTAYADLIGYRVRIWTEDTIELELEVGPQHLNRSGVLHGGVLAGLIDTACGYSGCYCAEPGRVRRASTLSLDVRFLAPVQGGMRLTVTGHKRGGGRQIYFANAEVRDETGRLVSEGSTVHKYRPGSEDSRGVPLA